MFKISVNNNAISRYQINKEVAKPPARQLLKEKSGGNFIENEEGVYGASFRNKWWEERIDIKEALKNAKVYKKDYERTLPETLSAETQNFMWKRAKQLKDEFTIGMLSKQDTHPVKGFLDNGTMKWVVDEEKIRTNRSVDREVAWQKKNELKINEYKNIMRHLVPDDPNAGDIERFRPK